MRFFAKMCIFVEKNKHMKKLLFFCFFVAGCTGNSTQDPVTFDEVTPDSKKEYHKTDSLVVDTVKAFSISSLSDFSQNFADSLLVVDSRFSQWDTLLFPDRFQAVSKEKWKANFGKDSLVFARWEFKDSIQTKNAFYNWLDCFGTKCKSVELNSEKRIQKQAFFILLTNKQLLFVESKKRLKFEDLHAFFSEQLKRETLLFWLQQETSGKVNWMKADAWKNWNQND